MAEAYSAEVQELHGRLERVTDELARVRRERDYLLEFADPKEVLAMLRDLADEVRGD